MFKDVKVIAALATTCLLTLLLILGGQHYFDLRSRAQVGDQRGQTLGAASDITKQGTRADSARAQSDAAVQQARGGFQTTMEEAKAHEPEIAARADRPVPPRVRNAFRERRLLRERLGRDGVEPATPPRAKNAAKR